MDESRDTPFSTGEQSGMTCGETPRVAQRILETCFALGVFCVVGGVLGFIGCIAGSSTLESLVPVSTGEATLSYGQEWLFISLPLSAAIGVGIGFASYLTFIKQFLLAGLTFLFVSGAGMQVVFRIWENQIADYGRDRSEVILYYPPTGACMLALVLGATMPYFHFLNKRPGVPKHEAK